MKYVLCLSLTLVAACDTPFESACAAPDLATNTSAIPSGYALVLGIAQDYQSSALAAFRLDAPSDIDDDIVVAGGNAVLRNLEGHAVVINRGAESNLLFVNGTLEAGAQIALPNCGPADVAYLGGSEILVTCFETPALKVVDLRTCDVVRTIDMSALAGTDGKTELDQIAQRGDAVYVTLQHLDRDAFWTPTRVGELLVLDADSLELRDMDAVTPGAQGHALPCNNPSTELHWSGDRLIFGCTDYGSLQKSGVGVFNVASNTPELLISGTDLGGTPGTVAVDVDGNAYAFVTRQTYNPTTETFDVQDTRLMRQGQPAPEVIYTQAGANLSGLAFGEDGFVYFGNRALDANAGVYIFDPADQSLDGPYAPSQPPTEILVFR